MDPQNPFLPRLPGHGNITPSPARRVMRDPPTSEHIILENVTSKGRDQGMNVPPKPTRATSENVIHQGTRSQGAHSGTTVATSAHVTCKNVVRGMFPAAPKAISIKEREAGPDADLSLRLTSLSHKPDKRWARGPAHGTHKPAGSCRRTRECYAEPSPPRRTGLPDTRAQQPSEYYLAGRGSRDKCTTGTHDLRENHTLGHQNTGHPWQRTWGPDVRVHDL